MGKVLGIDLGTTNSAMAVYENGEAKIIANKEGKNTTPSIVAFTDKGEVLVGESAKRQAITNPEKTIYSIKRIMGLMMSEEKAKEAQSKLPYKIIDRSGACAIEVAGKTYTPQEISAKVLMKMKEDAEVITIYYGEDITEDTAKEFKAEAETIYQDADIELYNGSQPVYYFMISAE